MWLMGEYEKYLIQFLMRCSTFWAQAGEDKLYFYGDYCPHCAKEENFDQLGAKPGRP
jgi:hypothetical protein